MKWTRWSAHGHQIWVHIYRWSAQIRCQIYPTYLSDEVNKMQYTWTSDMSSYLQMKCPDKLSDIPPIVVRWSEQDAVHMDIRYKFIFSDEVFRFRYPPPWNCQWQQINYCLIYVFNESPFETVTELHQLFRWSVQLAQLVRWSAQIYPPHLKLSVTGDEVIADLCLQWEPIQYGHGIRSSLQMKCPSRWTCQMQCTMRSDIPPSIKHGYLEDHYTA